MKRYEMFWNDHIARLRADGKWVRYEDARAVINSLQALLNERDQQLDVLKESLEEKETEINRLLDLQFEARETANRSEL